MSSIGFYGASGTVTGSNYVLTSSDNSRILVDLGMYQGTEEIVALNRKPLAYDPRQLTGALLTHAHLDHCGRLPMLVKQGFRGKIFMTEPTLEMMQIVLLDAAHIAEIDENVPQLYKDSDVLRLLDHVEVVDFDQTLRLGGFQITFRDAGHILGAGSLEMHDPRSTHAQKIVFSGDLGNFPHSMLVSPHMFDSADVVVMESTYGGRNHPTDHALDILQAEVNAVEESGGVLMIPSFAIQRTQELLVMMRQLKDAGKIRMQTPVYLDSPMAIKVTEIYKHFGNLYNDSFHSVIGKSDPFRFPGLNILLRSKDNHIIETTLGPRVIIAGSGMMSGGRILKHAQKYITHSKNRILFVGYQGEETLGREISEGAHEVLIQDTQLQVRAHITKMGSMSAHADESMLLKWLSHMQGVKKVFLTHGENTSREALAPKVRALGIQDVDMPELFDECALV